MATAGDWHVYVVRARDGRLYTGVSTDVERRLAEHSSDTGRGAKALRGRGPLELAFARRIGERGLALRVEHALKALSREEKEALIARAPARRELVRGLEA